MSNGKVLSCLWESEKYEGKVPVCQGRSEKYDAKDLGFLRENRNKGKCLCDQRESKNDREALGCLEENEGKILRCLRESGNEGNVPWWPG